MTFEDLKMNESLVNVLRKHNILVPTEIQQKTFPSAANGHDLIGISKTGSGKTLAFLLPILQQILITDKPFYCLILAPTRELALQISDTLQLFEPLSIRYSTLLGGEAFAPQVNSINKKPHIIVGTPGRIVMHIDKNKNFHLDRIRKLIFDEADRFFELDFINELDLIKKNLKKLNQTLMFTATLTEKAKKLSSIFMRHPKLFGQEEIKSYVLDIKESLAFIPEKFKLSTLYSYLKGLNTTCIIFVGLCLDAQKISETFCKLELSCDFLHGKMPQIKREVVVKRFREEEFNILIATDVASRGLDIPHVGVVVNYDLPDSSKIYTHRIGRTGRADSSGQAVTFVTQYDVEKFQILEHALGKKLEAIDIKNHDDLSLVSEKYSEITNNINSSKGYKPRNK